jgi:hypothetical protein
LGLSRGLVEQRRLVTWYLAHQRRPDGRSAEYGAYRNVVGDLTALIAAIDA